MSSICTMTDPEICIEWSIHLRMGSSGLVNGEFILPSDIAIDGSGNIYIAEYLQ